MHKLPECCGAQAVFRLGVLFGPRAHKNRGERKKRGGRMLNKFWSFLVLSAILLAALKGQPQVITEAALDAASNSVQYALGLIGLMSFWLGVMNVAEKAGLVDSLARLVRPLTNRLFPSVPKEHPALGFIVLNLSANVLGLGNAATPFGLKAMTHLQECNPHKDTASDAMITFLVLNTSCLVMIPATIIGIRYAAGSIAPTEIVATTFLATCVGMSVSLTLDGLIRRVNRRRKRW